MSAAALPTTPLDIIKQLPSARIVSIAPIEMSITMQASRGFKRYTLPAAARGEWTHLDVAPEMVRIPAFDDDKPIEDRAVYEDPMARAQKLVSLWAHRRFGHARRGAFGVAVLPIGQTEPDAGLLRRLNADQELLANSIISEATDLAASGQGTQITDELHRTMARWLLGNNAQNLPWYGKKDFAALKACPGCRKMIDALATRCDGCASDLLEWYAKYDPSADGDPVVAAKLKEIASRRQVDALAQAQPIKPPSAVSITPPTVSIAPPNPRAEK